MSAITPGSPRWARASSMMSLFGAEGWKGARSVSLGTLPLKFAWGKALAWRGVA